MGDRMPRFSDEAIGFLRSRPWRGNVRELQNAIEHVAVLCEPEQVIDPRDIPIYDEPATEAAGEIGLTDVLYEEAYHLAKDKVVAQFEKEYLSRVIGRANGNMSKAARLASIDRTTLYRLLDKHGLQRDELSGPGE
jgi:DNA-binding NtrC family response regulator